MTGSSGTECVAPSSERVAGFATSAKEISPLVHSREEPLAFVDFYDALSTKVLDFFARRTWNSQVSLDLTAETFAKAFEKRADFAGQSVEQAASWLWAIARNELGAYWRERYGYSKAVGQLGARRHDTFEDELLRVEDRTVAIGCRAHLKAGLIELGHDQREAIGMRLLQDLEYEEIAERLGISEEAARARVSRGLRSLRRCLPQREDHLV